MNKRFISVLLSAAFTATMCTSFTITASAAAKVPQYQETARPMEQLNRGLIASYLGSGKGVYLSWRLLGTESLENQAFDIYRGKTTFSKIKTTNPTDPTSYIDKNGRSTDKYKVVKAGTPKAEVDAAPMQIVDTMTNHLNNGGTLYNSYAYVDIPIERPAPNGGGNYYSTSTKEGGANDASVGDLDGDGDYEIVLKWDPTNSKDAAGGGTTGRTYIDGYEIDPKNNDASKNENGHLYKWRIDLGPHVRSGAHENPFLVYDFDGDGKAEIVSITGLGATDGNGEFVTKVGDTEEIRNADNSQIFLRKGKNIGPEYYTIFDGETGAALCTTDAIPIGPQNEQGIITEDYYDGHWYGDAKMNRSSRYLAAVAYVDGVHPSAVMCRGYYNRAMLRSYTWDGVSLNIQWEHTGDKRGSTLYGSGNHNLSVGDIDNDGKDEIVYGSASLDDDGKTVLGYTPYGHGDAMHMNDFNNDGLQEVFSVKEDGEGFKKQAENLRVASTGKSFWNDGKIVTSSDNGRGVMDNIDDAYAKSEYDKGNKNVMAIGWSSGFSNAHDFAGNDLKAKPAAAGNGSFDNSLVYWDGDLGRELLDSNIIQKYDAANGYTNRFYGDDGKNSNYTLTGGTTNNYTKRNVCLSVDLWGDWREEIIMATGKGQDETPALRIFTSTIPTDYRLTTLMHDSQYRLAIAWQNVGYNQPPHTSYYIGSAALATDENGNELNYLAPAVKYTKVKYPSDDWVNVSGVTLKQHKLSLERSKTEVIEAEIMPADATRKNIIWTSSDESVAKVIKGNVTGIAPGTATITATTQDGGFTDSCEVEVWSTPVEGITIEDKLVNLIVGDTAAPVNTEIQPANASEKSVVWSSSNEGVAKVSEDGTVYGVSTGVATIYATTVDGGYRDGYAVNVVPRGWDEMTGDNEFVTSSVTDEKTQFTGSATGGALVQADANNGAEFHKDFEVPESGKRILKFRFTTGGLQIDGSNWNWTGHEYNTALSFLDENGNNILTAEQQWQAKAGELTSKLFNKEPAPLVPSGEGASDWMTVVEGRSDVEGSFKRWIVTAEFDYDNDTCTVNLLGSDGNWQGTGVKDGVTYNCGEYRTTFSLNGAKFKTLKCETAITQGGTVYAQPKIEEVSYGLDIPVLGASNTLYKRGTKTGENWSQSDVVEWNGGDTLKLENDRLWYNITKPGAGYGASKTFDGILDSGILTYDVDWHFGNSTSRASNVEYIQFGSDFRLGWTYGYNVYVSTDAGQSWSYGNNIAEDGKTITDISSSIFTGKNGESYTKNVKLTIDTETKTIKSLIFDGKEISAYANYKLAESAAIDSVSFGFQRGGATDSWEYPCGIENITVSQFGENIQPQFTVQFADGDKILQTENLNVGEMPSFKGENPSKAQDAKYTYTFKGWSPNITAAIDNVIYRAQYNAEPRTYNVSLELNGGTIENNITEYTYGNEVVLPTPEKEDYNFIGWYAKPDFTGSKIVKIAATETGDKTYYAKWAVVPKVTIGEIRGNSVPISLIAPDASESVQIVGVLYDGELVKEVKASPVNALEAETELEQILDFTNNIDDYTLKIFIWNSLDDMTPLIDAPAIREKVNNN